MKWNQIENIDVSGLYPTRIGTFYKVVVITFEKAFLAKTKYDGIAKLEFYDDSTSTTSFILKAIFPSWLKIFKIAFQGGMSKSWEVPKRDTQYSFKMRHFYKKNLVVFREISFSTLRYVMKDSWWYIQQHYVMKES